MLLAANGLPLPRRGERPQNASVCVCISALNYCTLYMEMDRTVSYQCNRIFLDVEREDIFLSFHILYIS